MSTGPREAGRRVCAVQAARPKAGALPQGGSTPPEDVQLKPGSPPGRKPRGADIDTLTPIEAMNLLYELKKML